MSEDSQTTETTKNAVARRRRWRRIRSSVILLLLVSGLVYGVTRFAEWLDRPQEEVYTGYVVSDNIYLSASSSCEVAEMFVERGQRVKKGDPLFRMDATSLNAKAEQARQKIKQQMISLENEKEVLKRAGVSKEIARMELEKAGNDYTRYQGIYEKNKGAVSFQDVDHARIAEVNAQNGYELALKDISIAEYSINALEKQIEQSRQELVDAEQKVKELAPVVPVDGRIDDTMYQQGEWAAVNSPIVSLVPYSKIKVRFYVPQSEVNNYQPGTEVMVSFDGLKQPMKAKVDYVASRPEYTPPVIYSLKMREKLVFLIEAVPANPEILIPGQPLDVRPIKTESGTREAGER